ncbi:MAG: hypothetical protein KatS3mg118_0848 [Paracoccaceae bacterium]|nr:MAG: hypothetical protein KatS3mg118_0848 [Paracoccaceae bacterium]
MATLEELRERIRAATFGGGGRGAGQAARAGADFPPALAARVHEHAAAMVERIRARGRPGLMEAF